MKSNTDKHAHAGFIYDDGTLSIEGTLTTVTTGAAERSFSSLKTDEIAIIDGSALEEIDSTGAVFLNAIINENTELRAFADNARRLIELARPKQSSEDTGATSKEKFSLELMGGNILRAIDHISDIAILFVDILYWSFIGLFNRDQYRRGSFTVQAVQMGTSALPIVGMILFLVGAISALQSAETFREFGASIFMVDMLALGLAREMAPLMTAIIISGRSGSAIASEIATMKFTEELDAIKTMGLNPLRFVVVPKLWAMVVCMPLLTVMALLCGLLGGFLVAVTYPGINLSPSTFLNRVSMSLYFWDVCTGLIKSISFAMLITVIGVYRGQTFSGGADGVGRATTSSVVTSIFAIIIMDSIWGIIFYM